MQVGALNAVYMAQRGFEVHVYDLRSGRHRCLFLRGARRRTRLTRARVCVDPRDDACGTRVSINLALSVRGIEALRAAGCADAIVSKGLPMHSRKIHNLDGSLATLPYGKPGQAILSIDRGYLNRHLLAVAAEHPNVHLHFNAKLTDIDVAAGTTTFAMKNGTKETATADLVVGNDGVHSRVRAAIMRATYMNYSQEIISAGYKELSMPPTKAGQHAMAKDCLHIWPRGTFMMIGLPNLDGSFTMTLFLPHSTFAALCTPVGPRPPCRGETRGADPGCAGRWGGQEDVMAFFEKYFPDSIELLGRSVRPWWWWWRRDRPPRAHARCLLPLPWPPSPLPCSEHLLKEYFENPSAPLTSIKVPRFSLWVGYPPIPKPSGSRRAVLAVPRPARGHFRRRRTRHGPFLRPGHELRAYPLPDGPSGLGGGSL